MRPGQAGTLLGGAASPRDATGTIVDLAVRGYLRIERSPTGPGGTDQEREAGQAAGPARQDRRPARV